MWLKGNTESEEGLGWSTGPAPVKAQTLTATLGLQGRSELLHTSLSTAGPYYFITASLETESCCGHHASLLTKGEGSEI